MKIAILGFGREGKSLLKFLKKSPQYRSAKIEILDQRFDQNYLARLADFNLVFRSPGIPYNLSLIQRAIKNGVRFSSATKLFFDLCPSKIIGITGTKGKGTTATLLYQILKKSGHDVHLAGNIGKPAIDILQKLKRGSLALLELSSFQLQDTKKSPPIAAVVDTFPDHLDSHQNIKEYLDAKSNIAKHQKKSDVIFCFRDNDWSLKIASRSPGKKIGLSGSPFGLRKNQTMAAAIAAYLGCTPEKIQSVIKNFKGIEHRMEFVRQLNGVSFINDSASTNPHTAAAAVQSLRTERSNLIFIAGGKDKNLDYAPIAEAIRECGNVKAVILFGENKNKIKSALSHVKTPMVDAKDLGVAVMLAYKTAKKLNNSSTHQLITVLFSPASASFDMFKDYADRGQQFKKIVKGLKN